MSTNVTQSLYLLPQIVNLGNERLIVFHDPLAVHFTCFMLMIKLFGELNGVVRKILALEVVFFVHFRVNDFRFDGIFNILVIDIDNVLFK